VLWLGVWIQTSVLDVWFVSTDELDAVQMELNRQTVRMHRLEESIKAMDRRLRKQTDTGGAVVPFPQPATNAIERHLWRERLRTWGQ